MIPSILRSDTFLATFPPSEQAAYPQNKNPLTPENQRNYISDKASRATHRTRTDDLLFTKQLLYQLS